MNKYNVWYRVYYQTGGRREVIDRFMQLQGIEGMQPRDVAECYKPRGKNLQNILPLGAIFDRSEVINMEIARSSTQP